MSMIVRKPLWSTVGVWPGTTRYTPDNVRHVISTGSTTLMRPTAIVVDDAGAVYVSNKGAGFAAGAGEVLKIVP